MEVNIRPNSVRVNDRIRVPEIRCIDAKGEMLGVVATDQAKRIAREQGLDLVEVSPTAQPPVCRIMDYGKFQYTQNRKLKQNKKAGTGGGVKEVKFRASTEDHDYNTKLNKIKGFLEKGHKVKVTLFFRGRENAHRELGFDQIKRVLKDCEEDANVEMHPKMVGRTLVSMIAPKSAKGR